MGRPEDRSRFEGSLPDGALPCIWMSAGLVAYKLCDRSYECEGCPFDQAMRGAVAPPERPPVSPPQRQRAAAADGGLGEFPDDRRYHPAHTWAQQRAGGRVRVGFDGFFAWLAGRAASLVLAAPGSRLEQGRVACWLADGAELLPVLSPVSGRVRRRNEALASSPGLAAADPYGEGWLLEVDGAGSGEQAGLLVAAEAGRRAGEQREAFLTEAGRLLASGREVVGATLPDGGRRLADLAEMLGKARYYRLAARFLCPGVGRADPAGGAGHPRRS